MEFQKTIMRNQPSPKAQRMFESHTNENDKE